MKNTKWFVIFQWILGVSVVLLAFIACLPAIEKPSMYSLFPLFGLLAFSLMWTHYIAGALRRYMYLPIEILQPYRTITGMIVLFCILIHPVMFYTQLILDGYGLPPASVQAVYPDILPQLAIIAGSTALLCFFAYELQRYFQDKTWWRYVEWANSGAMLLILWHGFILGGELQSGWFRYLWILYGVTFIVSLSYSEYDKRKERHATN